MADWQSRSQIDGDVVFFPSVEPSVERACPRIFIWDLDKTYLDTTIDSLGGLIQAVVERAFAKKNIPATDILLQALAKKQEQETGSLIFPIYFITASPPQMEERISEKFAYDAIRPLGCFYKDNLKNIRPGRFWRLTKQVGYKLQALLQLRIRLGENVQQICFGDDSESDAVIYNLYSDICARRISATDLRKILGRYFVTGEQVDRILALQAQVPVQDPVDRIYINLATDTDPDYYSRFGQRTLATYSTYQLALDLFQEGNLGVEGVFQVADEMIDNYEYTADELTKDLDELTHRGVLRIGTWESLREPLVQQGLIFSGYQPRSNIRKETGRPDGWLSERVDYLRDDR